MGKKKKTKNNKANDVTDSQSEEPDTIDVTKDTIGNDPVSSLVKEINKSTEENPEAVVDPTVKLEEETKKKRRTLLNPELSDRQKQLESEKVIKQDHQRGDSQTNINSIMNHLFPSETDNIHVNGKLKNNFKVTASTNEASEISEPIKEKIINGTNNNNNNSNSTNNPPVREEPTPIGDTTECSTPIIERKLTTPSTEQNLTSSQSHRSENLALHQLFNLNRFTSLFILPILLVFYVPFGFLLLFTRLFCIGCATVLYGILWKVPNWRQILLKIGLKFFGMNVTVKNKEYLGPNTRLVVANCVSNFDALAIQSEILSFILTKRTRLPFLSETFFLLHETPYKTDALAKQYIRQFLKISRYPVFEQPEQAITSARTGLLKFRSFVFELDEDVLPVAIKCYRSFPFSFVEVDHLKSNFWKNLFWILFLPLTNFELTLLPPTSKRGKEKDEEFASRVQGMIAKELNIQATNFTAEDKFQLKGKKFI